MSTRVSKDRASLCLFAFNDGRRCRMLRSADPYLCNYHARKEAEDAARARVGRGITDAFVGKYVSASGLSVALARTLAATAQGQLKPKQAALIACLGRTLIQAIQQSKIEYLEAFGANCWRDTIRACFPSPDARPPIPAGPQPHSGVKPSEAAPSDKPTPNTQAHKATQPPSRPATASITSLPKDPAAFAAQVLQMAATKAPEVTPVESTLPKPYENKGLKPS